MPYRSGMLRAGTLPLFHGSVSIARVQKSGRDAQCSASYGTQGLQKYNAHHLKIRNNKAMTFTILSICIQSSSAPSRALFRLSLTTSQRVCCLLPERGISLRMLRHVDAAGNLIKKSAAYR